MRHGHDNEKKTTDDTRQALSLKRIVENEDLSALEAFCLKRKHQDVINYARDVGVDLETLEELLVRMS